MLVVEHISDLRAFLNQKKNQTIGFVPTMGALHKGHLSLIDFSKKQNDITVCSIFVNPTQFNNQEDLINYPKNTALDIQLLEKSPCDVLFIPSVEEIYPQPENTVFDFGPLSNVMEGVYRPGHFSAVAVVVKRFFEIIQPSIAYFGEKDFQQLAVIRALVEQLKLPIKIVGCPIVREKNGLAMSSRNQRLSDEEKQKAGIIFKALNDIKNNHKHDTLPRLKEKAAATITHDATVQLEYLEIADGQTLQPIKDWSETNYPVAFVAVKIGPVRLIDNMTIIS
ncbi:MAG: pantoate--beta-alanine ligase [Vicingus serpentipes]|nr:pantoate--beta-alanine ligase [Vicingus serpentipes]